MGTFKINLDVDSTPVLDKVIEAYGFTQKLQLAEHLDMAASSLSSRYKRGVFPADIVVKCIAETGANLEWLATGSGKKFENDELDIMKLPRKILVDGQLFESGQVMFDKFFFRVGVPLPIEPVCLQDEKAQYILDQKITEVFDGKWLVNIEGKASIRALTRISVRKVRVSGVGMAFDCALEDINVLGRVVLVISEGN
ncbi:phage repressor protein CI [Lelliottia sp. V106_10]|uniref:phage repressor protein CI n=1 Tax=Lelliottia wanjuensis TaxID=3050585 RepID=UPI0025508E09|nr:MULTISPECIES: phage repressor protein CI [unclassified Lelliottia]MDK9356364.1 phage repressor protein CI [Lelliottia sp. V106_16]MDK9374249.1 phage repressor protein CI [Lelliottia sp. V106_10]MDK9601519.1 phage repressor protein CI [Lelliottia sp. V106_5]